MSDQGQVAPAYDPTFDSLASEVAAVVTAKNAAYGNSFDVSGQFLRLLCPDGIKPDQYDDVLQFVRIFDKMKRVLTGAPGEDNHQDIAGYALLGLRRKRMEVSNADRR